MANLTTWITIIIINIISIVFGLSSLYEVINAYLNKKDLIKYQTQIINAFFMILIIPLFITVGMLKYAENVENKSKMIGIGIEGYYIKGTNEKAYAESISNNFYINEERIINLGIKNDNKKTETFSIEINCKGSFQKCHKFEEIFEKTKYQETIKTKILFKIPIKVYIKNDIPIGDYDIDIIIKDEEDNIYDSVPFKINIR
jgi:uncharacterized membrane protein